MWQNILHGFLEFLPFSSSTIMLLLGINFSTSQLALLHLPCGIAATIYWIPYLLEILRKGKLILFYIIATIIPISIGFYLSTFKDFVFIQELSSIKYRLIIGIVGSIVLFLSTFFKSHREEVTMKQAVLVGLFQSFAMLLPGLSRTGITLSCFLFSGFSYYRSMMHAVILGIPLNIGAAILATYTDPSLLVSLTDWHNFCIMLAILVTGFLSLHIAMLLSRFMKILAIGRLFGYIALFITKIII